MAGPTLRGYAVVVNVKIPSLAAALILTAAAAQAQFASNDFSAIETMGAYDPPLKWASDDCQHAPCALAAEPGKTSKTAQVPIKPASFADDTPVYNTAANPGREEGKSIAGLMAAMNDSEDPGRDAPRAPRAASAADPTTVVHVGGEQARINSGLFTFRQTRNAARLLDEERVKINAPGQGFVVPGEAINPSAGTDGFIRNPKPTRVARNSDE